MALYLHVLRSTAAAAIIGALREHGLEVGELQREAPGLAPKRVYVNAVAAPLSLTADQIVEVRARIGVAAKLVACVDILAAPERRALLECGASAFITPRGSSPELVAERILADAILAGALSPEGLAGMRGATPAMRAVYAHIERVARFEEPVLVLGENLPLRKSRTPPAGPASRRPAACSSASRPCRPRAGCAASRARAGLASRGR